MNTTDQQNRSELEYRGGQDPIVHLEANLHETVDWAERIQRRWAFTLSNAGATTIEDRCDLRQLDEIDWAAVEATSWGERKHKKQAEFLVEQSFPWTLIGRIGVRTLEARNRVKEAMRDATYQPAVTLQPDWYY